MTALEEKYNLEIPDADAEKIKTVEDVVSYISKVVFSQGAKGLRKV